jgi:tryptophan-rich sensory protein
LNKPAESPPSWVFAPVWTTLYVLMGAAFYLVWERGYSEKKVKWAMHIFGIQLGLNVLWSVLFFGLQSPHYAFIEILVLGLMIIANIIAFYDIDKRAGILLVPYMLWVSFATVLNYSIWQLNG